MHFSAYNATLSVALVLSLFMCLFLVCLTHFLVIDVLLNVLQFKEQEALQSQQTCGRLERQLKQGQGSSPDKSFHSPKADKVSACSVGYPRAHRLILCYRQNMGVKIGLCAPTFDLIKNRTFPSNNLSSIKIKSCVLTSV